MPDSPIDVLFRAAPGQLSRRPLREFARLLSREAAGGRGFTCLFTDDAEVQELNRRFRQKDAPTDVLSFPSGSAAGSLGDIAISLDRAAEQARELGHSLDEEVRVLMLHGVLHLTGLDHETDEGRMAEIEGRLRKALGLAAGLIERTLA